MFLKSLYHGLNVCVCVRNPWNQSASVEVYLLISMFSRGGSLRLPISMFSRGLSEPA